MADQYGGQINMNPPQKNIFVVGPEAAGDSFFGREGMIRDLSAIFTSSAAYHLVGPTRIGKSSLAMKVLAMNSGYPNRLCVFINMGPCKSAFSFWSLLSKMICRELKKAGLWDEDFEFEFSDLAVIQAESNDWFNDYLLPLQEILKHIAERDYRLVLVIDEFDHVDVLFGDNSYYYQGLRSIFSSALYATSGVIISRRRLQLLEAVCPNISTFHGVFDEITLLPFDDKDMEAFYAALGMYNIKLSSGGKKKLENYTGRMPYLCCMFANRMVAQLTESDSECTNIGDKEVCSIFKSLQPQIDEHYEDLVQRLEYDNHLEIIFYLSAFSQLPRYVTKRDIENLTAMGTLIPEAYNNSVRYYTYSKDFMTWFKLKPLKLPAWETMTLSEKKIKAIFKKEFPELDTITYDDLLTDVSNARISNLNSKYPELNLNSGKIKRFCEDLAAHKDHPTILDVLTLSEVVKVILDSWNTRFHKYFAGDESWKPKLKFIMELRNPMAHAAMEYIDQEDLAVCMQYCDEIIRMKY